MKPTLKPGVQQLKALPACVDVLKLRIDRFLAVVSW